MMTSVYNDNDLYELYKQKQKILGVFWIVTAVYAVLCGVCLGFYISLPYKDPMQTPIQLIVYLLTAPYVAFLFPYMGIKYSRVRRYYKALVQMSLSRKNLETHYFYKFNKNIEKWKLHLKQLLDSSVYSQVALAYAVSYSGDR